MKLSAFGEKFTSNSGILSLMDDLGNALASGEEMIMMGGGNPAHIPEVESAFKRRLQRILDNHDEFVRLIGTYDAPQGEKHFIEALVKLLNNRFGWGLTTDNIALTNGSQNAFFILFNLFAGTYSDGTTRQIQLPLAPEYIGYADAGLSQNFFSATRPDIELLEGNLFKYRVDFSQLELGEHTGAVCVSRPTNPTGNVITDDEVARLDAMAQAQKVPLIIDGAYGQPFPNLLFTPATPMWNPNTILCLSLSKLGLPALRTGIVIAREEVIKALSGVNAILSLSPNSAGSMLALEMIRDGSILSLSDNVIRPFYQQRAQVAVDHLRQRLAGYNFHIHKPEGAMFLWLWFEGLPISSLELYSRLKARGVLVVSGHYFFPGMEEEWQHSHECIRVTYTRSPAEVQRGLDIIAEEVIRAFNEGGA
ncbi:valine--pyruvate transaminase [Aestuariirhabdus litorea]|uniref:Valine--pyruvate transaminase n=1 Tax=Aestuariirhabdus litorea TaxID=2528527 RepID=A0A3P3VW57_9GAMM|nr:valine--pyruvate transaminase [Aestuariirhabdus litorea]RRJ84963.1 valine--pyruvate transaminase [Aestuariirhabdus litorea]RWW98187.1 valine--pyruvate transaminase [Endozoicomonadaceae bacterium GTF-13]